MALSLFGGKKHLHHFVAEQDVAKEFFALLVEAKTMYLRDVVAGSKQYHRYVEDFVNSHRYIDCNYNPQNEMFRLLGTKRSFSQNETFFFSHPYPALFRLISHF